MDKDILKEELGVSNDVKSLVSKIKNIIGDNFAKNYKDKNRHYALNKAFPHKVFHGDLTTKWENMELHLIYYVMPDNDESVVRYYLRNFNSTSNIEKYEITLYLVGHGNRIIWDDSNRTIQHEVEHLFQLYKKGKSLLTPKQNQRYQDLLPLTHSTDYYEKIIGFTYYYYNRVEKNALINGMYGEIMGEYIQGYDLDPLEEIKKTSVYNNIKKIKQVIKSDSDRRFLINRLNLINKDIKSYLRIANTVVNEYTKSFGRLLYLLKKDIAEANKDKLINLDNIKIED